MTRDQEQKRESDDEGALDQRITEYLKVGIPAATIAAAAAAGYGQGAPAVVLVLAAGTLVGVIAIFWSSVRTLVGETPLSGADAYALGAPRAEEEQKRAVLRALKDLEFERSVGKISEEDYQVLVTKYRGEAKRLLKVLDEESAPERQRVEKLVQERLREAGLAGAGLAGAGAGEALGARDEASDDDDEEEAPPPPPQAKKQKADAPKKVACAKCGTKNDPDATFCKKCGKRQRPDEDDEDEDDEEEGKEAES
jgi:ribosomal protein L40E